MRPSNCLDPPCRRRLTPHLLLLISSRACCLVLAIRATSTRSVAIITDYDWSYAGASSRLLLRASRTDHALAPSPSFVPTQTRTRTGASLASPYVSYDLIADPPPHSYVFEVLAPHLRSSLRAGKKTAQWTDNWCVSSFSLFGRATT